VSVRTKSSGSEYKITQEQIDRFAEASGGTGRIHTDPEYASKTSFGGTLVHGMYLLSLIERELSARLDNWASRGVLDVTFLRPVRAEEPFNIQITPHPEDAEVLTVSVSTFAEMAITGTARVITSER
jgi:acyl dehydratase